MPSLLCQYLGMWPTCLYVPQSTGSPCITHDVDAGLLAAAKAATHRKPPAAMTARIIADLLSLLNFSCCLDSEEEPWTERSGDLNFFVCVLQCLHWPLCPLHRLPNH